MTLPNLPQTFRGRERSKTGYAVGPLAALTRIRVMSYDRTVEILFLRITSVEQDFAYIDYFIIDTTVIK